MKILSKFILLLSIPVLLGACSKNDDDSGANEELAPVITQGSWTVHYYLDDGKDETSTYAGYVFTFDSNGSLQATKTGNTTSGTWTELTDSGKRKLILAWLGGGIPVELLEIEEDWVLKAKSATVIELTHSSSGNDELHLHKQ